MKIAVIGAGIFGSTVAIMAVPAHDERDYEFAKKYNLVVRPVIEPVTGEILPDEQARKSIVAIVEEKYNSQNFANALAQLILDA